MGISHTFLLDPVPQASLREALLSGKRQRPNIHQQMDADGLERRNEPINVRPFVANGIERRHLQSSHPNPMLLCTG